MSFPAYPKYKDSGVEWLGEVPTGWEVRPLKSVARLFGRIGFRGYTTADIVDEGEGAITLSPSNMTESGMSFNNCTYISWPKYRESPEIIIQPHDVLMVKTGSTLGKVAYVRECGREMTINPQIVVFKQISCVPQILFYFLSTPYVQASVEVKNAGSSIPTITQQSIGNFKAPIPPLPEQRAIASFLDRETSKIDALVAEQRKLIELLKEKRQAVISHAVTKGLNPDARMKDSGIEWLGMVPEHWEVVTLKRVATVNTGVAKGKNHSGQATVNVPYLRVANVQDGYVNLDEITTIEILPHELDRYRLWHGDVLMNEGGDYDKLGRGCVWESQIDPCITQNHVFAVRPHSVDPWWLNKITSSEYAQFYFMSHSKQSTNLASISSTNLMNLPVVLPPRQEQAEVLSFVNGMTSKFESLVLEGERAIRLLQERRTALISAAVTGKVDVRFQNEPKASKKIRAEVQL